MAAEGPPAAAKLLKIGSYARKRKANDFAFFTLKENIPQSNRRKYVFLY